MFKKNTVFVSNLILFAALSAFATAKPSDGGMPTVAVQTPRENVVVKSFEVGVEKTIIFFMNPNGTPCQMQYRILEGMASKLKGKAVVKYYKTTVPADRGKFFDYGVRGLPMLIITGEDGRVASRFSPGIQSEEAILAVINSK